MRKNKPSPVFQQTTLNCKECNGGKTTPGRTQDKPNTRASLLRVVDLRSSENDSTKSVDQWRLGWKFESDGG